MLVIHLLNTERHEHGKAFCCQCPEGVDLSYAKRYCSLKSVKLLVPKSCHLAKMLPCSSQYLLCIIVKLFLCICSVNHSYHSEHHSLVSCGKVVEKFL